MYDLISIIVPVYNVEQFIDRCIKSLINQTYRNIEMIFVDDGSTDQSLVLCQKAAKKDDRIKVFHQDYKGVSASRNYGLARADGNYIMFLDGDDEAAPNYVEKLYATLKENDLDIAQCCLIRVKNGCRVNELPVEDGVKRFSGIEMQMRIFNRDRYFTMCLCGKIFKKELFEGLRFPEGRINEDESLIYLLMYRAKYVGVIDDYLYYYHYNGDSITEKPYNIHRLDSFYMLEEKYAFYKSKGHTDFANKTASEYFSQMCVVFMHKFSDTSEQKKIFDKAVEIYVKDRKTILEDADLPFGKKVFVKLSYLSVRFLKVYGCLLSKYLSLRK